MQSQAGFSFLEVLIALFILNIGLLSFANVTLTALRWNQKAYLQSLADIQLDSMGERMRCCQQDGIIAPSCLSREMSIWEKENKSFFPAVKSIVTQQGIIYQLKISWRAPANLIGISSLENKIEL